MLYKAKTLKGFKLKGKDGEIGKVKELYFDDKYWTVRYLVAETGSWLSSQQVLISPYALLDVNEEEKYVSVDLTMSQIEQSPTLDSDKPVSRQFEESYYGYYGWPAYWSGAYVWGGYPGIIRDRELRNDYVQDEDFEAWDPHLRSTRAVDGYHIEATDGGVGHVDDFLIDDETWTVRYLIVDTRNFWPGNKVILSPDWITRVSWGESKVFVELTRESIKLAPIYREESFLDRNYESDLYKFYDRKGYWDEEKQSAHPFHKIGRNHKNKRKDQFIDL